MLPLRVLSFLFAALLLLVPVAAGQDAPDEQSTDDPALTVGVQDGKFGVGTASSWPAYGLSGTYLVNERVTAQAVLGFFGTISTFSGRGWYRFSRSADYDFYGFASVGIHRYDYTTFNFVDGSEDATETVLGLGAGAGIEVSLARLFNAEEFPPLFANSELGLSYANFDIYDFTPITFGFGIHYRFGSR